MLLGSASPRAPGVPTGTFRILGSLRIGGARAVFAAGLGWPGSARQALKCVEHALELMQQEGVDSLLPQRPRHGVTLGRWFIGQQVGADGMALLGRDLEVRRAAKRSRGADGQFGLVDAGKPRGSFGRETVTQQGPEDHAIVRAQIADVDKAGR